MCVPWLDFTFWGHTRDYLNRDMNKIQTLLWVPLRFQTSLRWNHYYWLLPKPHPRRCAQRGLQLEVLFQCKCVRVAKRSESTTRNFAQRPCSAEIAIWVLYLHFVALFGDFLCSQRHHICIPASIRVCIRRCMYSAYLFLFPVALYEYVWTRSPYVGGAVL